MSGNIRNVLVTGATGFLGEHVCRVLTQRGHVVRGLSRSRSGVLADLGVEHVRGDVMTGLELSRAMEGTACVFHLAGAVSRDTDDAQRMMRLHVDGTRRVLHAMVEAGVKKMVLASTSGTIAVSAFETVLDERNDYPMELIAGWPYYASKVYQERLAFSLGAELGIDVISVNPSLLLGPGDRRLSSTGDVRKFLKRQIPIVPAGGMSFVDVRDVAEATVNAMDKGQAGHRYLMGGPNWTMKEFFGRLARVSKVAAPRFRLPSKVSRWGAGFIEDLYRSRSKEPPTDRISVEMAEHYWWIDSRKAEQELGFSSRDPGLTLADTVDYLRAGVDSDL